MNMFDKIAIIGLGLIGSSVFHAARRKQLGKNLAGYDISDDVRQRAKAIGFADIICDDLVSCVKGADLVILCTPVGAYKNIAQTIMSHLTKGAILSDVGSVKGAVVRDVGPFVPAGVHFIPAHPIAGTEFSGPEAGFANLFHGRWAILTPVPGSDPAAVEKLKTFWQGLGSQVDVMGADHHDLVLAITSHLPHLIAYNIVGTAHDLEQVTEGEVIKYSASGFRDFTRIASSDPTMWRDVFLNNREAVLDVLGRFNKDLNILQQAVEQGDGQLLFNTFTRTRAIRRAIIEIGQDTAAADFGRNIPIPIAISHETMNKLKRAMKSGSARRVIGKGGVKKVLASKKGKAKARKSSHFITASSPKRPSARTKSQ